MDPQTKRRESPNILITGNETMKSGRQYCICRVPGTPGVGKSTLCEKLTQLTGLRWIEVSKVAKENDCATEYDEEYQCSILEEDRVRITG